MTKNEKQIKLLIVERYDGDYFSGCTMGVMHFVCSRTAVVLNVSYECDKIWVGVEWEGIYIHIRVMAPEQIHIMHIYSSENLQPFVKLLFQTILSMFGILNMSKFSLRIGNYFYC